jgi:hypothetical protein
MEVKSSKKYIHFGFSASSYFDNLIYNKNMMKIYKESWDIFFDIAPRLNIKLITFEKLKIPTSQRKYLCSFPRNENYKWKIYIRISLQIKIF